MKKKPKLYFFITNKSKKKKKKSSKIIFNFLLNKKSLTDLNQHKIFTTLGKLFIIITSPYLCFFFFLSRCFENVTSYGLLNY